jgi:hypothetical protein
MSLMTELPKYWMDGAVRALDGRRRGLSDHYPLSEDPPGITPYDVVFESGKTIFSQVNALAAYAELAFLEKVLLKNIPRHFAENPSGQGYVARHPLLEQIEEFYVVLFFPVPIERDVLV